MEFFSSLICIAIAAARTIFYSAADFTAQQQRKKKKPKLKINEKQHSQLLLQKQACSEVLPHLLWNFRNRCSNFFNCPSRIGHKINCQRLCCSDTLWVCECVCVRLQLGALWLCGDGCAAGSERKIYFVHLVGLIFQRISQHNIPYICFACNQRRVCACVSIKHIFCSNYLVAERKQTHTHSTIWLCVYCLLILSLVQYTKIQCKNQLFTVGVPNCRYLCGFNVAYKVQRIGVVFMLCVSLWFIHGLYYGFYIQHKLQCRFVA